MANVRALRGRVEPYRGTCRPGSYRFGGTNSPLMSANCKHNKISGCTTTFVQQEGRGSHILGKRRALFISTQQPPLEKRVKRGALITSRSSSSPTSLNRYLETAHYPTDRGRYQVVYRQQYTRHVERVKKALTGLNRRLKKGEALGNKGVVSRWSAQHADNMFPDMCRKTYCVPPVFINTYGVREDKECSLKAGGPVFKSRVTESDLRGDNSHRMVARAFEFLSYQLERQRHPCMFLISDYSYDNYFRWCRDPRQLWHECGDWFRRLKPDASLFSHGGDLESCFSVPENAGVQRHKTGLIVLHQDKGILLIQIKSIGSHETSRDIIKLKIEDCISRQLSRDVQILRELLQTDRARDVTRVLALPNISAEDLLKLDLDNRLANNVEFLLKDHIFNAQTGIPESQTDVMRFLRWWQQLPDKPVPLEVIKEIAGRYVGILSTPIDLLEVNERSRVRDFCDVTLFVGRLFKRLVLTDEQTNILRMRASDKRVYLCGPPGSGKTLLLIMRAQMFLRETRLHHVVVLNLYRGAKGRAIGFHIAKALCLTDDISGHGDAVVQSRVHHVRLDLNDDVSIVQVVQQTLPSGVQMKNVLFVIDEVLPERYWKDILHALRAGQWDCHVWCAGLSSSAPKGLSGCQTSSLGLVLRCPPSVQNVLQHVDWEDQRKRAYRADADSPNIASNGSAPLSIRHQRHQGGVTVAECVECAEELASLLQHELHLVRPQVRDPASPSDVTASVQSPVLIPCQIFVLYSVPRQQFRGTSLEWLDELELPADRFKRHAEKMSSCMFFVTLKEKLGNVTLRVVETLDDPSVEGGDNYNEILFSWVDIVQGLEKDVVIFLPGDLSSKESCSQTVERKSRIQSSPSVTFAESIETAEPHPSSVNATDRSSVAPTRKRNSFTEDAPKIRRFSVSLSMVDMSTETDNGNVYNKIRDIPFIEEKHTDTQKFLKRLVSNAGKDNFSSSSAKDLVETCTHKTYAGLLQKQLTRLTRSLVSPTQHTDTIAQTAIFAGLETVEDSNLVGETKPREMAIPGLSRRDLLPPRPSTEIQPLTESQPIISFSAAEPHPNEAKKSGYGGEHREAETILNVSGVAGRQWRVEDIARYSEWDQTNLLLAASRCCAQLIMIVP